MAGEDHWHGMGLQRESIARQLMITSAAHSKDHLLQSIRLSSERGLFWEKFNFDLYRHLIRNFKFLPSLLLNLNLSYLLVVGLAPARLPKPYESSSSSTLASERQEEETETIFFRKRHPRLARSH